jgi:hypothetical protein
VEAAAADIAAVAAVAVEVAAAVGDKQTIN